MDHGTCARQQPLVGRIVYADNIVRQSVGHVSFISNQKHRTFSEAPGRHDALCKEIARNPYGGRPKRKHERWRTVVEKVNEFARHYSLVSAVVESKSGNMTVRRPIRLRAGEERREKGQHERWRTLSFRKRIAEVSESQLLSKSIIRLRTVASLHSIEEDFDNTRAEDSKLVRPRPEWWHRRIVGGEK